MASNGKKFKNACFISYKHPPKTANERHLYKWFPEAFCDRVNDFLVSEIRAYIDSHVDIAASYPKELSQALCNSVCMIAILVPEYLESNWCQAEWEAMVALEEKRLGKGKVGLIIPIALKCTAAEWEDRLKRKPVDFSKVSVKGQLGNVKPTEKIKEVAELINQWVKQLNDPCDDCDSFQIKVAEETLSSVTVFTEPNPFT